MSHIVLVHPRTLQNTGSIGRMCFSVGFKLHIIKPCVFDLSEKAVKRAGLDYWDRLKPMIWESLEEFLGPNLQCKERFFFVITKSEKSYFSVEFGAGDFLFFGGESFRLPSESMNLNETYRIIILMKPYGRSSNLATSVGIVSYEALR